MNLVYILIHLSNPTSYEVASWDGNKEGSGWDNLIPFLSRLSKSFLILVSLKKKKIEMEQGEYGKYDKFLCKFYFVNFVFYF